MAGSLGMVSEKQLYLCITREILKKRPDRNICFPSSRLLCFTKLYQTAVCLFANAGFHGSSFISSLSRHLQTSQHIVPCFLRWLQKSRSFWPVQAGWCVCVCGGAMGAISSRKHMARSLARPPPSFAKSWAAFEEQCWEHSSDLQIWSNAFIDTFRMANNVITTAADYVEDLLSGSLRETLRHPWRC